MSCEIAHHPAEKYALMLRVCLGVGTFFAFCLAVALYFWVWAPAAVLSGAVGSVFVFLTILLPTKICQNRNYIRTRSKLIVNSGIFTKRTVIIDRSQMQCVRLRRNPVERIFGLCSLVFYCCGGNITLDGLTPAEAARLRRLFEEDA